MILTHGQHIWLREEGYRCLAGSSGVIQAGKTHVQLLLLETLLEFLAWTLKQLDLDIGMRLPECVEQTDHMNGRKGSQHANAQCLWCRRCAKSRFYGIAGEQDVSRGVQQTTASNRRNDGPLAPIEQLLTHFLFKLGDCRGDRGLRNPRARSAFREAAGFGDSDKLAYLIEFHPIIITYRKHKDKRFLL